MKETIRIINGKKLEHQYAKRKFSERIDFIDANTREAFKLKSVSVSTLKCTNAFNHCGIRNELINKRIISSKCPRCNNPETQDYAILCPHTKEFRKKFTKNLLKDSSNNRKSRIEYEEIFDIIEDILMHLEKGDKKEYVTNQHLRGMHYLLRGHLIKVQKGSNFSDKKHRHVNRILAQCCVHYFKLCLDYRDEVLHNGTL